MIHIHATTNDSLFDRKIHDSRLLTIKNNNSCFTAVT